MSKLKTDLLTLIAISAFSFMLATAVHEHAGHALACILLSGQITELGAFYVECSPASLADLGNRLVAFAGPFISLLAGLGTISAVAGIPKTNPQLKFFLWHFATVNLMTAAGYMLFSGVAGIGDLGATESGVFHQLEPEWLYRVSLAILGLIAYYTVIRISIAKMDAFIGGVGVERVRRAQTLSLISYLSGGVIALLVGMLNPHGLFIILASAIAASMGGSYNSVTVATLALAIWCLPFLCVPSKLWARRVFPAIFYFIPGWLIWFALIRLHSPSMMLSAFFHIFDKLNVTDRTAAVTVALEKKMIRLE